MKCFTIENIEIEIVERIDFISVYNDNYFKIKSCLGDYYDFYENDVMRIKSYDDEYEESGYIGKFVDGKFIPAL